MEKGFYLDANIFVFAYCNDDQFGIKSREILNLVINNKIMAYTSVLTFDEMFYQVKKLKGYEKALVASDSFINLRNLKFISIDLTIINYSYSLLKRYNLGPRDAIHLACALSYDLRQIITNDKDFDKVVEIKRFDIKDIHRL